MRGKKSKGQGEENKISEKKKVVKQLCNVDKPKRVNQKIKIK